ncbi:MAG: hypothetical protein ACI9U2_003996 [Bradymonadia bacterium]|jgi:hypothetical protein
MSSSIVGAQQRSETTRLLTVCQQRSGSLRRLNRVSYQGHRSHDGQVLRQPDVLRDPQTPTQALRRRAMAEFPTPLRGRRRGEEIAADRWEHTNVAVGGASRRVGATAKSAARRRSQDDPPGNWGLRGLPGVSEADQSAEGATRQSSAPRSPPERATSTGMHIAATQNRARSSQSLPMPAQGLEPGLPASKLYADGCPRAPLWCSQGPAGTLLIEAVYDPVLVARSGGDLGRCAVLRAFGALGRPTANTGETPDPPILSRIVPRRPCPRRLHNRVYPTRRTSNATSACSHRSAGISSPRRRPRKGVGNSAIARLLKAWVGVCGSGCTSGCRTT